MLVRRNEGDGWMGDDEVGTSSVRLRGNAGTSKTWQWFFCFPFRNAPHRFAAEIVSNLQKYSARINREISV